MARYGNNQNLNGLNTLAYMGVNASSPNQQVIRSIAPTSQDWQNFQLGCEWIDTSAVTYYKLLSLQNNQATWSLVGGPAGSVVAISDTSATPVYPVGGAIQFVGSDGITVTSSPSSHLLTIGTAGSGFIGSITGNSGGAVSPSSGNINIVGSGGITVTGNPGTQTLTITGGAGSFVTDSGTAASSSGVLNVITGNSTDNSGSSVSFTGSGNTVKLNVTDANSNTLIGEFAGNGAISGAQNTALGGNCFGVLTSGNDNVAVGLNALAALTSGSDNTAVGWDCGSGMTTGYQNVLVGSSCGNAITTGYQNTCVGEESGKSITTARTNVFVGYIAGESCTTGIDNTIVGAYALNSFTSGAANAGANTAVGNSALRSLTTGIQNMALGDSTGSNLLTGNYNFLLGNGISSGGINYTGAESSNLVIGSPGVTGESNVIRIGLQGSSNGQQNKCWIAGIRGVTTANANAIAVLIDSAGQLGTVSSSKRFKENIKEMADYSDVLYELSPVVFNYKNHAPEDVSVGLIAEEVFDVAPHLTVRNADDQLESVKYLDLIPMLLNEVQKLRKELDQLKSK